MSSLFFWTLITNHWRIIVAQNRNHILIYKYSALNEEERHLSGMDLILWEAIYWNCEFGYHVFDRDRSDLDNAGLREFKQGWGSKEKILHYSVMADRPLKASAGGKAHLLLTPPDPAPSRLGLSHHGRTALQAFWKLII